jgi:hypothetical protein
MLRITNDLLISQGSGDTTLLVALDLSAAFDTVNHTKLLKRAESDFGLTGTVLCWLDSYLGDRRQFVCVGGSRSATTVMSAGVPQGSVLGPILFSLYVSPISRVADAFGIQHHSYADDTTLYVRLGKQPDTALQKLESCTAAMSAWFAQNDMMLNPDKSEAFITLSTRRRDPPVVSSVNVAGSSTPITDAVKIIGVTLDSRLSMDKHVSSVCSSCNYHLQALRHIRPLLDHETACMLACSIVLSRLDYCNSVLGGTTAYNINRLQVVQNALARVVCRAGYRDSAPPLLKSLHWLPISQRIDFKVALIAFKVLTVRQPSYLTELLSWHAPSRDLRSLDEAQLHVPRTRTKLADRAFCVYAPRVWNSLTSELRHSVDVNLSVDCFKSRLKTFFCGVAFKDLT